MTTDQLRQVMQDYNYVFANAVAANADLTTVGSNIDIMVKVGSIVVSTPSTFNGTTTTVTLQASNDNVTWFGVVQDDNTTPMAFTLSSGTNTAEWQLKAVLFRTYRIVYVHGDASAGTWSAVFIGKK